MTISPIDYSLMAGAAYFSTREDINRIPFPATIGWQRLDPANSLDRSQDDNTGFEASALTRGNEIVIAFAGTYDKSAADKIADVNLGLGGLDAQLVQAAAYYAKIRTRYRDAVISFTGHSLGGGFLALAPYDRNQDGRIDASDSIWGQLRVWRQARDPVTGEALLDDPDYAGELVGLDELRIVAIRLDAAGQPFTDAQGNTWLRGATLELADDTARTIAEYDLARNGQDTLVANDSVWRIVA